MSAEKEKMDRKCAECGAELYKPDYAVLWSRNEKGNPCFTFICMTCSNGPEMEDITTQVTGGAEVKI